MNTVSKWVTGGLALVVVALLISTQVVSQEKKEQPKPAEKKEAGDKKEAGKPGADQMAEMMAKFKEMNAPGPMHKCFEKLAGKWDCTCKTWMDPTAPPMESKGKAEYTPIFGGRYVMSKFKGDMMGEPFEGMEIVGYDNTRKQYESIWLDSMSTAILMMTGTADESGKVITYKGKMDDCMTGEKDKPFRTVVRWLSDDKFTFEWFDQGPEGKEVKSMEIEYNRAK